VAAGGIMAEARACDDGSFFGTSLSDRLFAFCMCR